MANRLLTQTLWTGGSGGITTMNESTLIWTDQIGQFAEVGGKIYQQVQNFTTAATAVGGSVMWTDFTTNFKVSNTVADANGGRNAIAGVAQTVISTSNYGFIQVGGLATNVVSTGAITAGDTVIQSATAGTVASGGGAGTAPTYIPLGPCTVTAASNLVGVAIQLPLHL